MKRIIITLLTATILLAGAQARGKHIVILHTNDTHSCIFPLNPNLSDTLLAGAQSVNAKSTVVRASLQRDTAQAWLDLALSQQALQTAQKLLAETERQQGAQRASVATGSAAPDSVLAFRVELSAMRDKVTLAERDVTLYNRR